MTRFYHSSSHSFRFKSVKDKIFALIPFALLLVAALIFNSCEGGPTKIGSDLLPSSDFVTIKSIDTISVLSYTMYDEVIETGNPIYAFLGEMYDPYFGTTTAEFVSEVRLKSAWKFGKVTIDSVRMNLRLLDVKGGLSTEGNILRLSEINDQIFTDKVYYSNTQTDTTGFEIITQLPVLRPDTINTVTIPLPVSFGEYLVRDTSKLFYSTTKPDFRAFFKGLYFRISKSADPVMITFATPSFVTSTGLYYNYIALFLHDTANINYTYTLLLDPVHKNACYNKFSHDFTTADPVKKIGHINNINFRDTLSYLQCLNGVYTKVVFPGLDSLKKRFANSKFTINKARLTVPIYFDAGSYTAANAPASLRLRYMFKDSVKLDVPDYTLDASNAFFDGTLNAADSVYSFNIATFIQQYLEDNTDDFKPELEIFQTPNGLVNSNPKALNSVIFRANKSKTPVKFVMTYTKY